MSERSRNEVLKVEPILDDSDKTVVMISLNGLNRRTINHGSETTYEVISGNGTMDIDGEIHILSEGVTVVVPAGTPYHDDGCLEMRATSIPPFDINKVEFLS